MISCVVPIFNEQALLTELRGRICAALDSTGQTYEIIFVNDGSVDGSLALLRQFAAEDERIVIIDLSRNFGHQPAVTAGIHQARGDCVVLMDGDLQDPPEVIPQLLDKWKQGFQVVLAERRSRADTGVRSWGFRLFYPLLRRISDLPSTAYGGIFGLMDRVVVDQFNKLGERNRFIPGLRSWIGFNQTCVLYDRQTRAGGTPKQSLRRLLDYAIDGMTSFSYKPLRFATWLGFAVAAIGFVTALVFILRRLFFHDPAVTGFTTLLTMMMFLGGIQLITIGILGEYIGRIYEEAKQRPLYIIRERIEKKTQNAE